MKGLTLHQAIVLIEVQYGPISAIATHYGDRSGYKFNYMLTGTSKWEFIDLSNIKIS